MIHFHGEIFVIVGGTPRNKRMRLPFAELNVEINTPNIRPSSTKQTKSGSA